MISTMYPAPVKNENSLGDKLSIWHLLGGAALFFTRPSVTTKEKNCQSSLSTTAGVSRLSAPQNPSDQIPELGH